MNEVDGSVRVLVSLISGTLERNVTVRYFTSPGLATETGFTPTPYYNAVF